MPIFQVLGAQRPGITTTYMVYPAAPVDICSMIFYDPGYQPTPALPVLPPVKPVQSDPPFPLDREIVNFLRDQPEAVTTWAMVNGVAAALNPPNRSESRELKKQILGRITRLVHLRYIRRVGRNYLALR